MVFDPEDNIFMLAGPVKTHPRVQKAMAVPALNHRSPEFSAVNKEIKELLQYLFQTKNDIAIFSGSGTSGMEAAISNIISKNDKLLVINNGKFGVRLKEIGELYGETVELGYDWGKTPHLEDVEKHLQQDDIKAIALIHNETSTGVVNQLQEIAKICHDHDTLVITDGITSVGSIDVPVDKWGIDICIVSSQKCIAAPPGLSCLSVSPQALDAMHDHPPYYLNIKRNVTRLRDEHQTPFTPAIPLHLALREALRMIKEEGLTNRFERIRTIAEACRAAVDALGLKLVARNIDDVSDTVTAIRYPNGITDEDVREKLKQQFGIIVGGSHPPHKGEFFRIGHMGNVQMRELIATIGALEAILINKGHPIEKGAGLTALEEYL